MTFIKILGILLLLVLQLRPESVLAESSNTSCQNRYVTLVNPVRDRSHWFDHSLTPLTDQYRLLAGSNLAGSWLLQYDTLSDSELLSEVKSFDKNQEIGLFLEVSEKLAYDSQVLYPPHTAWYFPNAIFLSGYSQSDRRRLIDQLLIKFHDNFGYYPKSVGAWWIDSYSLKYLQEKYGIVAALIVADQKLTDHYTVWGQWWGIPYYPSQANILVPASSYQNKEDVVVIQWAQRDPLLANGSTHTYSNFSVQANDYIHQGKTTEYFKHLLNVYLDCGRKVGQLTIGLETGNESVGFLSEYQNQLQAMQENKSISFLTMSQFAQKFSQTYSLNPPTQFLGDGVSTWEMSMNSRINKKLAESIVYDPNTSFADYYVPDRNDYLNRDLTIKTTSSKRTWFPWFVLIWVGLGGLSVAKKVSRVWFLASLFGFLSFGLIFRSFAEHGWMVYFGTVVPDLLTLQLFLVLAVFLLTWLLCGIKHKLIKKLGWFLPISYALDPLITHLRFTVLENQHLLGFSLSPFHFVGLSISPHLSFQLLNIYFSYDRAGALLKFDFNRIWNNFYLAIVVYPLVHLLLSLILGWALLIVPRKLRIVILVVIIFLLIWQGLIILQTDPRVVTAGQ